MIRLRMAGVLLATGAAIAGLTLSEGRVAYGADHRDGPVANLDPTVDITDVYAWMNGDNIALVLDIQGGLMGATSASKFSTGTIYSIHTTSGTKFGETVKKVDILCQFDAAQKASCWVQDAATGTNIAYVTGDASSTSGIKNDKGDVVLFAGLRDDPFFFNIRGFRSVASTVKSVAGMLKFDAAGCPTIDAATTTALVGLLKSGGAPGTDATDDFGRSGNNTPPLNGNVLSIVLQLPKAMLTSGGSTVSVWASTNKSK